MAAANNNNWPGKIFPIGLADLKKISAGALKIAIARWMQPDATQPEIAEMTGYTVRQVRNLTRELDERQPVAEPPKPPLTPDQSSARSELIALDFDHATADKLARRYTLQMIRNAINYTMLSRGIKNTRGAIIDWLERNREYREEYSEIKHKSERAHYERFWDTDDAPATTARNRK